MKTTRVRGSELKAGRVTVVLIDDDNEPRRFTVKVDDDGDSKMFHFKRPNPNHYTCWLSVMNGNSVDIPMPELTEAEKYAKLLEGLREDASNPTSKRLLAEIGEK